MKIKCFFLSIALLAIIASTSYSADQSKKQSEIWNNHIIRMATTTSTENSGLLDWLLPVFKNQTGLDVQVISVGTGNAIKLGERGAVDVILVHARKLEDMFVHQGFGVERRDVMHNDFIIIGPPSNPAQIKGMKNASEVMRQIARLKALFISRGDESGTHQKEKHLWDEAGIQPTGRWYISAGQGMGAVLIMAQEKQAYTLTDRGTFISFGKKLNLIPVFEGDPVLFNPYGIIAVNPEKHRHVNFPGAMKLIRWITSNEAQNLILNFKKNGKHLFYPDALKDS